MWFCRLSSPRLAMMWASSSCSPISSEGRMPRARVDAVMCGAFEISRIIASTFLTMSLCWDSSGSLIVGMSSPPQACGESMVRSLADRCHVDGLRRAAVHGQLLGADRGLQDPRTRRCEVDLELELSTRVRSEIADAEQHALGRVFGGVLQDLRILHRSQDHDHIRQDGVASVAVAHHDIDRGRIVL